MSEHRATVTWTGDLKSGGGDVKAATGAFASQVHLKSRIDGPTKGETTPEELIAGAHATCFSMMVEATLGKAGYTVQRLETEARVTVQPVGAGLKITKSALSVTAHGPSDGLSAAGFADIVKQADVGCPVSNAMRGNVEISVEARLG